MTPSPRQENNGAVSIGYLALISAALFLNVFLDHFKGRTAHTSPLNKMATRARLTSTRAYEIRMMQFHLATVSLSG